MATQTRLKTKVAISRKSCKGKCQAIHLCNAFVFNEAENECDIMSVQSSTDIQEASGKVFGLNYCSGRNHNYIN